MFGRRNVPPLRYRHATRALLLAREQRLQLSLAGWQYDSVGRYTETVGDDGLYKCAFEFELGRTIVTNGDGGRWVYVFDRKGRNGGVDPYGGALLFELDDGGRIIAEVDWVALGKVALRLNRPPYGTCQSVWVRTALARRRPQPPSTQRARARNITRFKRNRVAPVSLSIELGQRFVR